MTKQLLIETRSFVPKPVTLLENQGRGGNIFVEGILATVEIKNGNGRYYPKRLWEREINKFIQKIEQKSTETCGELDHPSCFIDGYKILTQNKGWVDFKDLVGDEFVATINPKTRELEFQQILKVINQPYNGDIINIESKTFQANVTPNHRFIIENHNETSLKFIRADEIKKGYKIPKKTKFSNPIVDNITLNNEFGSLTIDSNLFSSFMGWWLSEGWLSSNKKGDSNGVSLSQTKIQNLSALDEIFTSLSIQTNSLFSKYKRKNNEIEYRLSNKVLWKYLSQFGLCDDKFIPNEIKTLDHKNIELFLTAYLNADGNKQYNQEVYYTTSNKMALDLMELISYTGYMSSISEKLLSYNEFLIEGKWITEFKYYNNKELYLNKKISNTKKKPTGRTLYSIRRKYSTHYHLNDCNITTSHYQGNIHCVSVPNETILVMSPNGSTFFSGNSQIINLQNSSHIIRKAWWEGDNIMGLIEVLSDQGELGTTSGRIAGALIKNGLNIGISSRGMGSLEQNGNIMEVQDDFDLLTFDFVSNPSNPGSWFRQGNQLNEGVSTNLLDPYAKVNNILTDILCSKGTCPLF